MSNQFFGTKRPPLPMAKPVGVCIQELAVRIQPIEVSVPAETMQVESQCSFGPTRFIPNSMMPRNPASRKKAVSTS